MPQGLKRLRVGGVLPLTGSPLTGSPASLSGSVDLVLDLAGQGGRFRIPACPVADSGGRLVRLEDRPIHEPHVRDPVEVNIREGQSMSTSQPNLSRNPSTTATSTSAGPLDVAGDPDGRAGPGEPDAHSIGRHQARRRRRAESAQPRTGRAPHPTAAWSPEASWCSSTPTLASRVTSVFL